MKKIMFNDKYGLTQAVLEGRKTMTRRIVPQKLLECIRQYSHGDEDEFRYRLMANAPYEVGEIVAIAQSYATIGKIIYGTIYNNKMFVKAEYMPHHIRILRKWHERLQDISRSDCLREGIIAELEPLENGKPAYDYNFIGGDWWYDTPKEAFAALIDKVSGKGTWESNPLVWVYEFKLID